MSTILKLLFLIFGMVPLEGGESHQATGVKVGEVTDRSAIVWVRLTAHPKAVVEAEVPVREDAIEQLPGACPGRGGQVRVRYGVGEDLAAAAQTEWAVVSATADFTHQFHLKGLRPDTVYYYSSETRGSAGEPHAPLRGRFRTAPAPDRSASVLFTVITGMMYEHLDDREGFNIFPSMARLKPAFLVPTGDTVYYDRDKPFATSPALARYHWHRMYALPRLIQFHLEVPGYWEKDDHDTLIDDCWPGKSAKGVGSLTFEEGCRIFRQQTPMGEKTFRTFRWGSDVQIWLTEGRDFRSPNTQKDGPEKSIWGAEQKTWLKETLLASDAEWRILINPTPIIGPDRSTKADSHANAAFANEGNEFRRWATQNLRGNFFVICGDRHWQYHSVDPTTGLNEFSCGPASDLHAGGSPGKDAAWHRFHRVKGGFLSVAVTKDRTDQPGRIAFRHHDVSGKVVYEHVAAGAARK